MNLDPVAADAANASPLSPTPQPVPSALRAVHTPNFPGLLRRLGASLLVTTYQAGKLVMVRDEGDHLNTHFRTFQAPMGLALHGDRLAIGTTVQVWEYVDVPAVDGQARAAPAATTPASCRVAATSRATSRSTRWPGAPARSCGSSTRGSRACARSTASASFTPRWRPPFVTALEPTDRCHLNGLGMVDGRPRYVTALGQTDAPAGWRPEQGARRDRDGRRQRRAAGAGPVDAALAAMVRRAAVGLRVGRGHARVPRPAHRPVRGRRRDARVHPRAGLRRQPGVRRALAGARDGRLQRHPDHRAAHGRGADLRRLRGRPDARASRSRSCGSRRACRRSSPCRCCPAAAIRS